jgi:hypothetical protein
MNVGFGNEAVQIHSWEYLNWTFGTVHILHNTVVKKINFGTIVSFFTYPHYTCDKRTILITTTGA